MKQIELDESIPTDFAGKRLDSILPKLFPDYSRARWQTWLEAGAVLVDGKQLKGKSKMQGGERIQVRASLAEAVSWQGEAIPLAIVFEDDYLLVVNKPAGMVVHPAPGHQQGTLVNALLHYCPDLNHLPRAGIIHRLDKDTSGLLIVAKDLTAHQALVDLLAKRDIHREYRALVYGNITAGGTVDAAIDRHPNKRTHMAVSHTGKPAITHYRVAERFNGYTLLSVMLETGRTHQIRVHMTHRQHSLVGDMTYGRMRLAKGSSSALIHAIKQFKRQALHAAKLAFTHPITGKEVICECPLPDDMNQLLQCLRGEKCDPDFN